MSSNEFMLKFKVKENEFTVFPDGRAIITGTNDLSTAKSLYSKYLPLISQFCTELAVKKKEPDYKKMLKEGTMVEEIQEKKEIVVEKVQEKK